MKKIFPLSIMLVGALGAYAQSPIDAYRLSQPDLKGTARYMSMAGAFGALGGDLSTLSHNPGGIGVYRNSEVGFTVDLDLQHSSSNSGGLRDNISQTKFLLNNIGCVWTLKLPSATVPNFNVGFTYNKDVSFNRRYKGMIGLGSSLSNYIASATTNAGISEGMLLGYDSEGQYYDPYNPPYGFASAPWLSILGYGGYLFSAAPLPNSAQPNYIGQWEASQTSGMGYFDVTEAGTVDSYNIALGGNIANVIFWGMDFDITHMSYTLTPNWGESLQNAVVGDDNGDLWYMQSRWNLSNYYRCSGTGFNYKLGVIVKPIQEFRLGFSFETPTWYGLTESFSADLDYRYGDEPAGGVTTNNGNLALNDVNFKTPWKINASAAAVLFNKLIISAEYEWTQYKGMRYSDQAFFGGGDYWDDNYYDPWWPYMTRGDYDPFISNNYDYFSETNNQITQYYRNTNTLRLGAEFRVTPQFSVRAGYSFVSSPVQESLKKSPVTTGGTIPNYRLDNTTNYVTCGLGYRIQSFYIDLAYVYKHMSSEYYAYSPFIDNQMGAPGHVDQRLTASPKSSLSLNNSQIVLSAGFKF